MNGWFRLLVLVGMGSLLTGCLGNGTEANEAVAAAESALETANLKLAKEQKSLADTKASMAALQAEIAGLKNYASQVDAYLEKEMAGFKAARAADQVVFQNRTKGKGSFIGEIRTVSGVYGPGKISDFLADGVLVEQSSGVKQVPYSQLPAELQSLYVFKPYEPGPAPVMDTAAALASTTPDPGVGSGKGTAPSPAPVTAAIAGSTEEIPVEVANMIPSLRISEVTDSYLRNLLVDAELNVDRIRKKKVELAAMEEKLGGSVGTEMTKQKQARIALEQQDQELRRQISEVESSITQLRSSISSAQGEMSNIPSRVAGNYGGSIKPSAAQVKAETEKQSKVYRDAIARANTLINEKNSLISQKEADRAAIQSQQIALDRKINELEQTYHKNQRELDDLDDEKKDLQRLVDNQKALFLQIQARDAEVKKQDELIKGLRK